jgi:UDP-glucose 4-epimerase
MDYIDTNIRGTTNLVNAILRSGVEKFIYASSMSVYSSPPLYLPIDEDHPTRLNTMYGASKLVGEWLCRCLSDRMCSIILRFVSVYGVGDTVRVAGLFMQAALSGKPLLVQGDGTQSSDFIYVDDAVQGLLCARARGATGAYNIGSGRETSIKDLARTVIQVTDSKSCIEFSGKTNKPYRFVSDVSRAKRELGYSPEYSLVEGLRKYKEEMTQCSG